MLMVFRGAEERARLGRCQWRAIWETCCAFHCLAACRLCPGIPCWNTHRDVCESRSRGLHCSATTGEDPPWVRNRYAARSISYGPFRHSRHLHVQRASTEDDNYAQFSGK